jgi:methionyl-tRNA formyltransferase
MAEKKRIVLWCGDAANQKSLANKIAGKFNLAGVVIDTKSTLKKPSFVKRVIPALQDRIFFNAINNSWTLLMQQYARLYPQWPKAPLIRVGSINSDEAFEFTQQQRPDLIVVSGTALVKSKMLSLKPSIGIINLHTGLSPYIKGGPNCTNWCISTGQYNMIGNTIMWINEGIDSGNIITTELTPLPERKSLDDIQWRVMEHAHELYLRAISYLINTPGPHQSIPQKDIAKGKLYLSRMWNYSAKKKLLKNLPAFLKKEKKEMENNVTTVPIR